MSVSERRYKVGGLCFGVSLAEPFSFMNYVPAVQERINAAASGASVDILPTRAGDEVPARTYVRCREELPQDFSANVLDFSQYEPFLCEDDSEELFHLSVCSGDPAWLGSDSIHHMLSVDENLPAFYIYDMNGETIFAFDAEIGKASAYLKVSKDYRNGEFHASPKLRSYSVISHLATALMMMYTYNCSASGALLMHASVVRHEGLANVFFGVSGTGKSTHSRLWLENIEGTDLLNDDNPVLRVEDGAVYVYGSPWSGKTPCYRNVKVQVGKIVKLHQAPENSITRTKGLMSYIGIISSASSIRWDHSIMDAINANASSIAMTVPCFELGCLPDADAARTCMNAR
ncbi:MAG: hypothetical protein MJY94_00475 [Bacteroidales bacterium]|nr:hypothetical protein [Bacteroidales bacterium]